MRKVLRMSPVDWWGLGRAYVYLLAAGCRIFVRGQGLDRWLASSPAGTAAPPTSQRLDQAARQSRWVNTAARYPWPWARCLQRSLALCMWMEKQGFQPSLKIGVRLDSAALAAHAWVEYGGRVINDTPSVSRQFTVLQGPAEARFSREGRWI